MPSGTIKSIVEDRGFGFIEPSEPGEDIFFHMSELEYGMEWCDQLLMFRVDYDLRLDQRSGKYRASNVRPAS